MRYADKEEIINYLEMVITFGAVSKVVTKIIKASRLPRGMYPGTENIIRNPKEVMY